MSKTDLTITITKIQHEQCFKPKCTGSDICIIFYYAHTLQKLVMLSEVVATNQEHMINVASYHLHKISSKDTQADKQTTLTKKD